jgi:hypothetical protein
MLALAVTKLPEGPAWAYELKFDGYRALGVKANGKVRLLSERVRRIVALADDCRHAGNARLGRIGSAQRDSVCLALAIERRRTAQAPMKLFVCVRTRVSLVTKLISPF